MLCHFRFTLFSFAIMTIVLSGTRSGKMVGSKKASFATITLNKAITTFKKTSVDGTITGVMIAVAECTT